MIGDRVSHYRIIEKIGEGGMGVVYLAEDTKLERRVALKFLPVQSGGDGTALARLRSEARAAAALHHPNIVTIYEVGACEGRDYIAMAYIPGTQLHLMIAGDPLPLSRTIAITLQLCDALEEAHMAGVIHRDLKPENIIIDDRGRPHLLDFGLALRSDETRLTRDGSIVGTLSYSSPEQLHGDEVDRRTDIFSLGAILYEMICRQRAFPGPHEAAVHYRIINEDPPPLDHCNRAATPKLQTVISKALEKDREHRFQTMSEFAASLHALSENAQADTETPVSQRHRTVRHARTRGRTWRRTSLDALDVGLTGGSGNQLLAVDETIRRLEEQDEPMARIVRLRFYAGLPFPEIALILGIPEEAIKREWAMARAWIYRHLPDGS